MDLDSDDCLQQVMAIKGVLGVSLVDFQTGLIVNAAGREPSEDRQVTAAGVVSVVHAALGGAPFASHGIAQHVDDILVTAGNGYHLVYLIEPGPDGVLVLYVWLDRLRGNLAMAQRRIRSLTDGLVAA